MAKLRYEKLFILNGKNDGTIEIERVLEKFNLVEHTYKLITFENSGHNILEDKEYLEATETVVRLLQQ
jgi:esterase/lipase